jgi:hypothetical protein
MQKIRPDKKYCQGRIYNLRGATLLHDTIVPLVRCYHIYDYLRKSNVKEYSATAFHFALSGPFNRLRSVCFHHVKLSVSARSIFISTSTVYKQSIYLQLLKVNAYFCFLDILSIFLGLIVIFVIYNFLIFYYFFLI